MKATPPEIPGTVTISREAFHATVHTLDVMPNPQGNYDQTFGYLSRWETPRRTVIGYTHGGTTFSEKRYMVTQDFYEANKSKIETN
jgi:hypothetical protein